MRLSEHQDFDQAVLRAVEHFSGSGLRPAMVEKDSPINPGNKKVLIFTAFADTANYLYEHLADADVVLYRRSGQVPSVR